MKVVAVKFAAAFSVNVQLVSYARMNADLDFGE